MTQRFSWIHAFLVVWLFGSVSFAQEDAPPADKFYRRVNAKAAVINNYVYIDGGQVSEKGLPADHPSDPVNGTLALDLSKSWSPKTVQYHATDKPDSVARLVKNALFVDQVTNSFYIWGGRIFNAPWGQPPPLKLWKFAADKSGGGEWSTEDTGSDFTNLIRSEDGAYTSAQGAGFWIGGSAYPETTKDVKADMRGVVSFNFTTKEWKNHTEAPFSEDGTVNSATATYIPSFGVNGLIMLLGGLARTIPDITGHLSFDTLHFFDPVTMKWYEQATSGDKPQKRSDHCAVGVQGNGTYEIFVYGGWNQDYAKILSDIYVLSLPAFTWTKVDNATQAPRTEHECLTVGKRQMLSIGGAQEFGAWQLADPYPQGLGIFDMAELKWKDAYDANAAAYQTPQVIKKWYDDGNLDKMDWSSKDVKALFVDQKGDSTISTVAVPSSGADVNTSSTSTGTSQTSEPTATDPENTSDGGTPGKSATPTGVIVGGVVSGVVALGIIIALIFYLTRRRREKLNAGVVEIVETDGRPITAPQRGGNEEFYAPKLPPGSRSPASTSLAPSSYVSPSELGDTGQRHELP